MPGAESWGLESECLGALFLHMAGPWGLDHVQDTGPSFLNLSCQF